MTNETRLAKLKQAQDLIREVEFSYPSGDRVRRTIFKVVVDTFNYGGSLSLVVDWINHDIAEAKKGKPAKGETKCECPYVVSQFEHCPECRGSFSTSKPYGQACPHCGVNIIDAYEKSDPV